MTYIRNTRFFMKRKSKQGYNQMYSNMLLMGNVYTVICLLSKCKNNIYFKIILRGLLSVFEFFAEFHVLRTLQFTIYAAIILYKKTVNFVGFSIYFIPHLLLIKLKPCDNKFCIFWKFDILCISWLVSFTIESVITK